MYWRNNVPTNDGCSDDRVPCCDVDCDIMQTTYQGLMEMDQTLSNESRANIQTNNAAWRHIMAQKYREVDPIEAAATETILNGTARNTRA